MWDVTHQWTRADAADLIAQGYSPEDVAGRCGLTVRQVRSMRKPKQTLREAVEVALTAALAPPAPRKKRKPARKKAAARKPRKKADQPRLEVVKTA